MVLARGGGGGGFVLTGFQIYICPGSSALTSCTPTAATTVTHGHILLVMTSYCPDSSCTGTLTDYTTSITKSSGTATIGSCQGFAGGPGTAAAPVKAEIWWCPVTGDGTIIPVVSYTGVYYPEIAYVDVGGANASPDDGVGNLQQTTGTSVTVALAGAGASQTGELLIFAGFVANSGASASLSSGWTMFSGTSFFGYNPNGVLGANSVTANYPSNGTGAVIGVIAALKHP